jgi:hypothetical protein
MLVPDRNPPTPVTSNNTKKRSTLPKQRKSKKVKGGSGGATEMDENDFSKDGENSLSQSLFDEQTSSRTPLTGQKLNDFSITTGCNIQ